MQPKDIPVGYLRASDADRRKAEDVLSLAYAQGRITRDEHSDRITRALAAKTYADLDSITADLQSVTAELARTEAEDQPPRAIVDLTHPSTEVDRIFSLMDDHKRIDMDWRLRAATSINAIMADVHLDLTRATFESESCEINLFTVMADVSLFLPARVRVENSVKSALSSIKLKGLIGSDGPELVLTGTAIMSDIKIFGPDHQPLAKRLFKRKK